ncbi:MAG: GNAT family N-acetyltransferase [Gemmatimonadota bacterium]
MTDKPRRASEADVAEIVRVVNLAYRVEDFFLEGDRTNAEDIVARLARPEATILVVDDPQGATLVAVVYVELRVDHVWFGLLSVDPAAQGRGHARALLEAVERRCGDAHIELIEIEVVNLREELPEFYRRLGFALVGQRPFYDAYKLKRPAHMLVMRKRLGAPAV